MVVKGVPGEGGVVTVVVVVETVVVNVSDA